MSEYHEMTEDEFRACIEEKASIYCPVCGKTLLPANAEDVISGANDGFVFVHDDVHHSDSDIEALGSPIQ